MRRTLGKGLFSLAVFAALGFGATQALAAPARDAGARLCGSVEIAQCDAGCKAKGYDGGFCDPFAVGRCRCFYN